MLLTEVRPAPAASVLLMIMALFDWFDGEMMPPASAAVTSGDFLIDKIVWLRIEWPKGRMYLQI